MHPLIQAIIHTLPTHKPLNVIQSKTHNYAIEQYKTGKGDVVLIVFFPFNQSSLVLGFLVVSHPERFIAYCEDLLNNGVSTLGELQRHLNISAKDNAWNDNILYRNADGKSTGSRTTPLTKLDMPAKPKTTQPVITSLREVARDTTGSKAVMVTTDYSTGILFRADLDAIAKEIDRRTARILVATLFYEHQNHSQVTARSVVASRAFLCAIKRPATITVTLPLKHKWRFNV